MASATVSPSSSTRRYKEHGLHSLTLRLIGVNILAMVIIGIWIVQTGQFRNAVVETELTLLENEVKLISTALGREANRTRDIKQLEPYLGSLSQANNRTLLLYDATGQIVGFARARTQVPSRPAPQNSIETFVFTLSDFIPIEYSLPVYQANTMAPHLHPDRTQALAGNVVVSGWQTPDQRLVFSAGAPIRENNRIIGAIVLVKDETQTEAAMMQTRVDLARIFLAIFAITAVMLIYFAAEVGRPLNRLVDAAERIRTSRNRSITIPDLSHRRDEIGTLSIAFRDMTSALWTRMDSIERFAADVAHELKNPLSSMRSAIETLPRVKTEEQREQLTNILSHDIRRMDRLITDISRASRIDAELSREALERVDLRNLLAHMHTGMSQVLTKHNVSLDILYTDDAPYLVTGSHSRLSQVFENLVANAISFSPQGGHVRIVCLREAGKVQIHVNDEGPGIPPGKEEKIFERFYSERPSTEQFGEHSGLGLAICRQIVMASNGTITATNIIDEQDRIIGARLIVRLLEAT